MKIKALAIALLLAVSPAWANPDEPHPILAGEAVPADGVWLSSTAAAKIATKYAACDDDRQRLKAALEARPIENSTGNSWLIPGLAGIALGFVVGLFIKR